jgi:hypothetical protein
MTRQCEMVWPIFWGESYVGETGESMEVVDLAAPRKDKCRNIAIALIDRIVSVMALFRQLSKCHAEIDGYARSAQLTATALAAEAN